MHLHSSSSLGTSLRYLRGASSYPCSPLILHWPSSSFVFIPFPFSSLVLILLCLTERNPMRFLYCRLRFRCRHCWLTWTFHWPTESQSVPLCSLSPHPFLFSLFLHTWTLYKKSSVTIYSRQGSLF